MAAPGQLDLDGGEQIDPRIEKAAEALWWRDAKRSWSARKNGMAESDLEYHAKAIWPRVRAAYMETARVALDAAGVL